MADQVSATIVKIGTKAALPSALTISFPTENITIEAIIDSPIANSVITYNKEKFYAEETQSVLVTAANQSGSGTTPTWQQTLIQGSQFSQDNTVGLHGYGLTFQGETSATDDAGDISIIGNNANNSGKAGNIIITGGKRDIGGTGGDVTITSGSANENDPGSIFIVGANGTVQAKGGDVIVTGGDAIGDGESAGGFSARGGVGGTPNGQGGNIDLTAGSPGAGGVAGNIIFTSGTANDTGNGGTINILSGLGGATSGNGGDITIQAGQSQGGDGNGGNIILDTGEKNGIGLFGQFTLNYFSSGDPHSLYNANPNTLTHTFTGKITTDTLLNLAVFNNSSPSDGDIWRADNTNTGLKIQVNGVTKTIIVS